MGENCFPLTPEGGTGGGKIGKNLLPPSPEGGTGGREIGRKTVLWLINVSSI